MKAVDAGQHVISAVIVLLALTGLVVNTLRGHTPEAILYAGVALLVVLAWRTES